MMARVDIRLDPADKARLQDEARIEGRSLSELARDRLLGRVPAARRLDVIDQRVARLEETLFEGRPRYRLVGDDPEVAPYLEMIPDEEDPGMAGLG